MTELPRIIALTGPIGAGKTTVAHYLRRDFGYQRVRFAEPLKAMLAALGLTPDQLDGHLKETPTELLCGKSPRHAMQTLGTEWGRTMIGDQVWVQAWRHAIAGKDRIVVDDCRFPNEAAAIKAEGGRIWRVTRPGMAVHCGHASESYEIEPDRTFVNNGTLDDLEEVINDHLFTLRAV